MSAGDGVWVNAGGGAYTTSYTFIEPGSFNVAVLFDQEPIRQAVITVMMPETTPMTTAMQAILSPSEAFPFINESWFIPVAAAAGCCLLTLIGVGVFFGIRACKKDDDDDNDIMMRAQSFGAPRDLSGTGEVYNALDMAGGALPPPDNLSRGSVASVGPPLTVPAPIASDVIMDDRTQSFRADDRAPFAQSTRGNGPGLQPFEIPIHELTFDREVGRGAYGVVYLGTWRDSEVAIKKLQLENASGATFDKELRAFQDEAQVMKGLRPHANVILLLGITPPPELCIVAEYCENGSLYALLHSDAIVDDNQKIKFCKGIASGMSHLHTEGIIHRDLATRNILLSEGNTPKISDFGLSRFGNADDDNQTKSDVGPLKWMAPEAIKARVYGKKTDVWSYGVTVWEIVARDDPFRGTDPLTVATQVCYDGLRLPMVPGTPPILVELMSAVFVDDPNQRPDFRLISRQFRERGF